MSTYTESLSQLPGVSVVTDTGAALATFFAVITDVTMWRSLGWIALGIVMIVMALVALSHEVVEGAVGSVAKKFAGAR